MGMYSYYQQIYPYYQNHINPLTKSIVFCISILLCNLLKIKCMIRRYFELMLQQVGYGMELHHITKCCLILKCLLNN